MPLLASHNCYQFLDWLTKCANSSFLLLMFVGIIRCVGALQNDLCNSVMNQPDATLSKTTCVDSGEYLYELGKLWALSSHLNFNPFQSFLFSNEDNCFSMSFIKPLISSAVIVLAVALPSTSMIAEFTFSVLIVLIFIVPPPCHALFSWYLFLDYVTRLVDNVGHVNNNRENK